EKHAALHNGHKEGTEEEAAAVAVSSAHCLSPHFLIGYCSLLTLLRHAHCLSRHLLIGCYSLLILLRHAYCLSPQLLIGYCYLLTLLRQTHFEYVNSGSCWWL
ncbi:hypothetical protein OTU49_017231, partial [Cherax quadricarinatus]